MCMVSSEARILDSSYFLEHSELIRLFDQTGWSDGYPPKPVGFTETPTRPILMTYGTTSGVVGMAGTPLTYLFRLLANTIPTTNSFTVQLCPRSIKQF